MSELAQATLLGLLYWVPWTRAGYTFSHIFRQPISLAAIIGVIVGDLPAAVMIGATMQLMYLVLIPAGSNIPADEGLSACVAIPIAVKLGLSPALALMLAIPIGMMGLYLDKVRRTKNVIFAEWADKYAAAGDDKGIFRCATLYPMLLQLPLRVIPVFVAVLFGSDVVMLILKNTPVWLLHGLEITGICLPAVGFALTINVIGRRNLLPYFVIGFLLIKFFSISIAVALFVGIGAAVIHTNHQFGKGGDAA
ncbi:MAG: PTS sugar transporter subunit IIC [Negativicutes bacterium]|nr:PTS sugar transporter subunit IIC [Negativicutes bacterium]